MHPNVNQIVQVVLELPLQEAMLQKGIRSAGFLLALLLSVAMPHSAVHLGAAISEAKASEVHARDQ